MSVKMLSL